jgi:hypothetical protein
MLTTLPARRCGVAHAVAELHGMGGQPLLDDVEIVVLAVPLDAELAAGLHPHIRARLMTRTTTGQVRLPIT